ncbi:hypothetical protein M9H77_34754 [Catharanthus roseus]|uniref:Uncharacterized protein n=1 Tax=Catharanthus roseus TaxID=4058 RepID=A0ACB9ZNT5_CATRO|nr:hypothetical protein M9H77_34754 [Catharanthus roseus]
MPSSNSRNACRTEGMEASSTPSASTVVTGDTVKQKRSVHEAITEGVPFVGATASRFKRKRASASRPSMIV